MSQVIYLGICPKCASFKVNTKCQFCNIDRIKTNISIDESMTMNDKQKEELINYYIETVIKDTYDPRAREHREANEKSVFAGYIPNNKVACPYCKSTNTSKITITNKAVHTAVFGIWSMGRNAKQWHCNSCKSDF